MAEKKLRKGEFLMPDGRYRYRYTDPISLKRISVYSWKLNKSDRVSADHQDCICLRDLEVQINRQLQLGINTGIAKDCTLNEMFDKYIESCELKKLKKLTVSNYKFLYSHYVSDMIGKKLVKDISNSELLRFLNSVKKKYDLKTNSLKNLLTILNPTFQLAVDDNIIMKNPCYGVRQKLKGNSDSEPRHALTKDEQKLFIEFLKQSKVYSHWLPWFTFFLGTGCRVGEALGLRWSDVDFQNNTISINHNLVHLFDENRKWKVMITDPKTASGCRTIRMFNEVREALLQIKRDQFEIGLRCQCTIDGYTDFIFLNKNGNVSSTDNIDVTIKRIIPLANKWEAERAEQEHRTPVILRHFSVHNLRHTFCTRLCEKESDLKYIQDFMGHSDIKVTMNIYNELQKEKKDEISDRLEGKLFIC